MLQSRFRPVDRYSVLAGRAPLVERITELVPPETHYLVLDLDRTVHLGVTLGEVLGWEILSDPRIRRRDGESDPEPFFAARRPVASTVNFARGLRDWGLAGLMYSSTVRLGDRWPAWEGLLVRHLGSDYVDSVQSLLRNVLMARASSYSARQLEVFADRAWRRNLDRLVIDRAVVERIREHCPDLRAVILSSASTTPTVAHAAKQLGVDAYISSGVDVYEREGEQLYATPAAVSRWFVRRRAGHLSRPGAVFHNSSVGKVRLLHMHHPEIFADGIVSVGVSDNNFGEDRYWPDYFTHAVALNSTHPFSPFVGERSPCRSIAVLDASPVVDRPVLGRKLAWHGLLTAQAFGRDDIAGRFGAEWQRRLLDLESALRAARQRMAGGPAANLRLELAELGARFASGVETYNRSTGVERKSAAHELRTIERRLRAVRRELDRATRECSILQHALEAHRRGAGIELAGRETRAAA